MYDPAEMITLPDTHCIIKQNPRVVTIIHFANADNKTKQRDDPHQWCFGIVGHPVSQSPTKHNCTKGFSYNQSGKIPFVLLDSTKEPNYIGQQRCIERENLTHILYESVLSARPRSSFLGSSIYLTVTY